MLYPFFGGVPIFSNIDIPFFLQIVGLLAIVLLIVGVWQRIIDGAEKKHAIEEIHDARERGTSKAITQFPHINPLLCIGCGSCIAACPEDNVIGLVGGIAQVIHGSRCVGHASCEVACPVNAIHVGLGDTSLREDIPILSPEQETSVPGIYIAGELAGIALIRNAINQGQKAIVTIAEKLKKMPKAPGPVLDVLIVGSGPAGLSASLKAKELGLNFLTIDKEDTGGTVRKYPRKKLTLVQTVDLPLYGIIREREYEKEELIEMWDGLIKKHSLPIRSKTSLIGLKKEAGQFGVQLSSGTVQARFVLLAIGRRGTPRKLNVPGEERSDIYYQLGDAVTYQGSHILIVGGGDSAVEAAMGLANQPGNTVTISYRKPNFFRLKSRNETRIQEYLKKGRIKAVFSSDVAAIEKGSVIIKVENQPQPFRIKNQFVFIFAGGEPPYPLLKSMGIKFGGNA